MIAWNIVTKEQFVGSIQENIRLRNDPTRESNQRRMVDNKLEIMELLSDAEIEVAEAYYDRAIDMIKRYIPEGAETDDSKISIWLGDFRDGNGYQMISEGSVSDMKKPERDEYNWHFQNTSQWLFAFGIVWDTQRRDLSTHT